jgi:hypothetical protein
VQIITGHSWLLAVGGSATRLSATERRG